jgi:hypothetical protein
MHLFLEKKNTKEKPKLYLLHYLKKNSLYINKRDTEDNLEHCFMFMRVFDSVVVIVFQIIFRVELHVNDVFLFLKNNFWHQHIKTI